MEEQMQMRMHTKQKVEQTKQMNGWMSVISEHLVENVFEIPATLMPLSLTGSNSKG